MLRVEYLSLRLDESSFDGEPAALGLCHRRELVSLRVAEGIAPQLRRLFDLVNLGSLLIAEKRSVVGEEFLEVGVLPRMGGSWKRKTAVRRDGKRNSALAPEAGELVAIVFGEGRGVLF